MDTSIQEMSGQKQILVVDDDASIRDLTSLWLSKAGFQVQTVEYARVGLKMLHEQHFDMLITDIFMPDMDGHELILNLGSMDNMKIIAMSAGSDVMPPSEVLETAMEFGAVRGLNKPLQKECFLNEVHSVLNEGNDDE